MILLSIDPSIATIGYSVWIDELLAMHGFFAVKSRESSSDVRKRLLAISSWTKEKVAEFRPDIVLIEEQVFRSWGGSEKFGVTNIRNLVCAYTAILISIPEGIRVEELGTSQWMHGRKKEDVQKDVFELLGEKGNHNAMDSVGMAMDWFKRQRIQAEKERQTTLGI